MKHLCSLLLFVLSTLFVTGQSQGDTTLYLNFGEHSFAFNKDTDYKGLIMEDSYTYIINYFPSYDDRWTMPVSGENMLFSDFLIFMEHLDRHVIVKAVDRDSLVYAGVLGHVISHTRDTISLVNQAGHESQILGYKYTAVDKYGYVSQGYINYPDDRTFYEFMPLGGDKEFVVIEQLYYIEEGNVRARCIKPNLVIEIIDE